MEPEVAASNLVAGDNKFSALNTAVWSGGSFIYVPKGVNVTIPLQAYFRINTENMGQFERTLIIADEGSHVHYVEGCTAPIYKSDSLHSAVVEIVVKKDARVRYTTIQNWSNNVYNLASRREVRQSTVSLQEVLDGLRPDDTRLHDEIVQMLGQPTAPRVSSRCRSPAAKPHVHLGRPRPDLSSTASSEAVGYTPMRHVPGIVGASQ